MGLCKIEFLMEGIITLLFYCSFLITILKNSVYYDEYVYDLEVEDGSHTFFANDILVHNSIYVRMDNILKLL